MLKKLALPLLLLSLAWVNIAIADSGHSLKLKNLKGGENSLGDYLGKGKWVLFNIWGPSCPPCLDEVHELTSFHEDHEKKDAIVVSLALDFPSFEYARADEVKEFVEEYFVNFPVLLGDARLSQQVTGRLLRGTPTTYVYDPDGELVAEQIGAVTQEMIEKFLERNSK